MVDGAGNRLGFLVNVVDVEDPQEKFHVLILGSSNDVGNLVAVGSIEADDFEPLDYGKIRLHLGKGFAGVVRIIR